MKQTFAKQIHIPIEIKKDLEKMCIDKGTDPKNFIQNLVIKEVERYKSKNK
jgi:hypothetical protein